MTYQEAAQMALDVQDASNLSGVVHSFSEQVMPALWEEAHKRGEGTAWVNHHPIATLFIDKLVSLNGTSHDLGTILEDWDKVRDIAKGVENVSR